MLEVQYSQRACAICLFQELLSMFIRTLFFHECCWVELNWGIFSFKYFGSVAWKNVCSRGAQQHLIMEWLQSWVTSASSPGPPVTDTPKAWRALPRKRKEVEERHPLAGSASWLCLQNPQPACILMGMRGFCDAGAVITSQRANKVFPNKLLG